MDMITYAKAKKYADKVAATGGNTELIESLVTEEVTKVVTQSDWEQNDETALSFIKNKPFGKTDEFIETEIYNTIMTSYSGIIQSGGPALELGHTYKLVFGTHEFIAEARQEDGWFGVGYLLAFYNPLPDDMPFCYIDMSSGIGLYGIQENLFEPNMSFSIYRIQPKINYLSREYIEEYLVGRKDNIQNYEYKGQTYNSELGAESFNSSTNIAIGSYSHAEGNNTIALGSASHAEGNGSDSIGFYSHAEGIGTESVGNGSHAEGSYTKAIGNSSHAEGLGTEATSNESHAEGWYTVANTPFLHVQGAFNIPEENPTLFGWIRSNLGNQTYDGEKIVYIYNQRPSLNKTTGIITAGETTEKTIKELKVGDYFSFTNNANSIIDSYLHASEFIESEVNSETNNTSYTWIFYSYTDSPRNTQPGKYLHIVGNGTYSDRLSNAHTLEANGTAWYAGDVYVGSTSGVNRDEGSKKLLTNDDLMQPDWNQNDEDALDFIKNKPFYNTGEYDFIPVFENVSLGKLTSNVYFVDEPVNFVLGDFYKVVFNGVDYICEAKKEEKQFEYVGNPVGYLETFADIMTTDFSNLNWGTGEPFCLFNGILVVKDTSKPKVSLYKRKPIINALDREYIDYIPGENTSLKKIIIDDIEYICGEGSEIFNDYVSNKALGSYSHAGGFNTLASGAYSHTSNYKTIAEGAYSHAEGYQTKAIGLSTHAEGDDTEAKANYSHAEGISTKALGNRSHVEGDHTIATGAVSHVQGKYNLTDDSAPRYSEGAIVYFDWPEYDGEKIVYLLNDHPKLNNQTGKFTITNEITEIAYKNLQKDNLFLFTRPEGNIITNYYKVIELVSSRENGNITLYKYNYSNCTAHEETGGDKAKLAHIVGNGTKEDARSNAHTLDWEGNAWFAGDVYVGSTSGVNKDEGSKKLATEEQIVGKKTEGTVVTFEDKEYTCAAGAEIFNDLANKAIGQYSHAEGSGTVAMGLYAHAEGMRSQAIGNFSHAENYSQAPGGYAHSEGSQTVAKGIMSHAEGWLSEASGNQSHVEGHGTVAIASRSHVQGMYNKLDTDKGRTIYASASMGLGENKTFNSNDTVYVLEGNVELNFFTGEITADSLRETLIKDLQVDDFFATTNTNITEYYSLINISKVTETQLTGYCVTMMGVPYENLGKYAHIVGNGGSAHARSNAHTLDWDGNAWYAGSVECTSFILKSSTEGSNKRFRITIDDSGELHTAEIVE